jgi:hypothetical protein
MLRRALMMAMLVWLGPMAWAQSPNEQWLTPADVEKATHLGGVQRMPGPVPGGRPGDLRFAQADGAALLVVNFFEAAAFEQAKKPIVSMVGGEKITTDLFHAAVTGVGDDAFDGPNEDVPYLLDVRVGSRAFSLVTFFHGSRSAQNLRVTPIQLRDIGKILAARMR